MSSFQLESFETDTSESSVHDAAFDQGFAAGHAAGLEAAQEIQGALSAALVQAISDIEFKYAEARGEITRSLAPFLSVIVRQVLPQYIANGFADLIAASLGELLSEQGTCHAAIVVHPDQRSAIETALTPGACTLSVSDDPRLSLHAAWLRYEDTEIHIDQDKVLADISDRLAAIDLPDTRTEHHG